MFAWLLENSATIIVCVVLIAVVAAIIFSMVGNRKKGKSSCSCSCSNCPMNGFCNK